MMITYWKNLRTRTIYKYFGDATPYNLDQWERVTAGDYFASLTAKRA